MDETKKVLSERIANNEGKLQEPSFGFFFFCVSMVIGASILLPFIAV